MSLLDNPRMRMAIAKAQSIMQRHHLDTTKCKTTSQLADAMDKAFPPEMAAQARALMSDRQSLNALLFKFTGDPKIAEKLDAIYDTPPKRRSK